MTDQLDDDAWDEWQLSQRKSLQGQVRAAYEVARAFPSALTQGQAQGISMY